MTEIDTVVIGVMIMAANTTEAMTMTEDTIANMIVATMINAITAIAIMTTEATNSY